MLVLVTLAMLVGYVATESFRTERLLTNIKMAQEIQRVQFEQANKVSQAQAYSRPLADAIKAMASENSSLLERELQAAKVVAGLQQESTYLKASLKEAVEKLQQLNNENNNALEEINKLEFKVKTLQAALDAVTKAKEPVITNDVVHGENKTVK
jgi:chromosome segregation ATPase